MEDTAEINAICQEFVKEVKSYNSSMMMKPKIHLLLHLSKNMEDFGPPSSFNTERCSYP